MIEEFENKIALVTGGTSGIGQATAIAFSRLGARVVIADCKKSDETLDIIKREGGFAIYISCDVSIEDDVKNMINKIIDMYGRLDYAFNNAGIEGPSMPIQSIKSEDFEHTLNVNLKSIFYCLKHQIPEMLKNGTGAIVNCSSVAGLIAIAGSSPYVASKHAVIGLTKTIALENAKTGVRINAVCPGVIHTSMIDRLIVQNPELGIALSAGEPIGRMGEPEEVADAVIWLCSKASSFITGIALPVDGGWTAQ